MLRLPRVACLAFLSMFTTHVHPCTRGICTSMYVIQRGNIRQASFASDEDFAAYAHWLEEYAIQYQVAIHAWVFLLDSLRESLGIP